MTPEQRIQAERARAAQQQATPPQSQARPLAEIAGTAFAAAAGAALAVGPGAVGAAATAQTAMTAAEALAKLLQFFDRWLQARAVVTRQVIVEIVGGLREDGDLTADEAAELADEEAAREARFAAASRERLARDLPAALAIADPAERREAVRRLLERERRFAEQREEQVRQRAQAAADRGRVRKASPDGAYWDLNPLLDNCATCKAMAGKVWPWSVLNLFRPPVHPNCACRLLSVDEALRRGLIRGWDSDYGSFEEWSQRRDLLEAAAGDHAQCSHDTWDDVDAWVVADPDVMEARYSERYEAGTVKGGQFKPKRGANPGRPTARLGKRGSFKPNAPRSKTTPVQVTPPIAPALSAMSRPLRDGFHAATDEERKAHRIPPAWTDVQITDDRGSALQVVGWDGKGREQRRYSREHTDAAAVAKFDRVRALQDAFPGIERQLRESAKSGDVAAGALLLIALTGMRPGSERDTGAERQAYGATTLQAQHIAVVGDTATFTFVGKSGKDLKLEVTDGDLAEVLQTALDGKAPGEQAFAASDSDLRSALKAVAPGFKVKDLRTRLGTAIAQREVESMPEPLTDADRKRKMREVATTVSKALGNTPAIALNSYIDPTVFAGWNGEKPVELGGVRATPEPARASRAANVSAGQRDAGSPSPGGDGRRGSPGAAAGDSGSSGRGTGRADLIAAGVAARKPDAAGEVVSGVMYDPDITRSVVRDGLLHVPPGFFRLSKTKRESVLRRFYGDGESE